jgi:hypothetical protein
MLLLIILIRMRFLRIENFAYSLLDPDPNVASGNLCGIDRVYFGFQALLMLLLAEAVSDTMNSKELNVNVPLATVESDSEEFEVSIAKIHLQLCDNISIFCLR